MSRNHRHKHQQKKKKMEERVSGIEDMITER